MKNGYTQTGPFIHSYRTHKRGKYIVGIADAYNAMGLIGPELNGIFVLDDKEKQVVLDCECPQQSGYFGPNKAQYDRLSAILLMTDDEFQTFINNHERTRL